MSSLERINDDLRARLQKESRGEVSAIEATTWLDASRLLAVRLARPGHPLRRMLRDLLIAGQEPRPNLPFGRWWIQRIGS